MPTALARRPRIGLSDFVFATLTESSDVSGGTLSYGAVQSLPYARMAKYDPAASHTTVYGDDRLALDGETVGEQKITLEFPDIYPSELATLMGHTYSNGQLIKGSTDQSAYIALGFKQLAMGIDALGSKVYEYVWFYKVKLTKMKMEAQTKEAKIVARTFSIDGIILTPLAISTYEMSVRTDDPNAASLLASFFATVVIPNADTTNLTATISESGTAPNGKVRLTFAKTSGLSFTINAATITADSFVVSKNTVNVAGTFSAPSTTPAASQTVDFTPTVAFSAADKIGVSATKDIQDNSGIGLTTVGAVVAWS